MNKFCAAAAALLLIFLANISCTINAVNVVDYGARGDGKTIDNEAFTKAWLETCNNPQSSPLIIPQNKSFLLQPILFSGPCKSLINIQLSGEILAIENPSEWKQIDEDKWIVFKNVNGLVIDGNGKINGRGNTWWDLSCKKNPKAGCGKRAPTALNFIGCNGVSVSNIKSEDSPQVHMSVYESNNTDIGFVNIKAPEDSPNTDGIHIQNARDVRVHNSDIGSGDDCVSIGDQTSNINVTDVHCGPGHGVSIGSLGKDETKIVQVSHITVTGINFTGTTNGARIKTWADANGRAEHIKFSNLNFAQVKNPIIIDQHYCDSDVPCSAKEGRGVQLDDVIFAEGKGTSASEVAIKLDCSEFVPCTNIVLDTITLTSAIPGKQVRSNCTHAQGHLKNTVLPDSSTCFAASILRSSVSGHIHQHDHSEL